MPDVTKDQLRFIIGELETESARRDEGWKQANITAFDLREKISNLEAHIEKLPTIEPLTQSSPKALHDIGWAISELKDGNIVHREGSSRYLELDVQEGFESIVKVSDADNGEPWPEPWKPRCEDLLATDYVLVSR